MKTSTGPDFLCIGAPKTGTTWLHHRLAEHPQIWLPPVKELHYFDQRFPLPKAGDKVTIRRGFLGLFPQHNRRRIARVILRGILHWSLTELRWAFRYFGEARTDEWYLSLFMPAAERISGDLTTDYCALPIEGVRYVRRLLPEVKVIFLMRNPIERAWSHAKVLLPELLGKPLQGISTQEFLDYLAHPGPRARGDYLRTLTNWEDAFPSTQIFIGFTDDLSHRPQAFLEKIWSFVGVASDAARPGSGLDKRVNAGPADPPQGMPREIARALARFYMPDLMVLNERFGPPVSSWFENARAVLDGQPAMDQVTLSSMDGDTMRAE